MDTWRLLETPLARGAWNMAADEALREAVGRGESSPLLRLYSWAPGCLSLGLGQSRADVDDAGLAAHGWDLVRRASGGRAILHIDELTYSVIAPIGEVRVQGSILESYRRLAQALMAALRSLGLPVEMQGEAPPSAQTKGPVCFEVPSSYEIVIAGKKLVGSAQARNRDSVLQHGTLPLSGDLSRITRALAFPDKAARDAAAAKLLTRATTVETVLGSAPAWELAAAAFVAAFEEELALRFVVSEMDDAELLRTEELVQTKYAHADWTGRA
ncbi:MAG: lipoate--protein ligase family protein [Spirochaetota bacterium]